MAWMPGALRKVIPASNYSSTTAPSIGAVVHVIVGSANSAIAEFQTPGAQLSAHFVVSGPGDPYADGTIFQMLDTQFCAYAQAAGNYPPTKYTAIETSGQPEAPMSAAQEAAVARIIAWDAQTQGYPITGPVAHGQPGVTGHCNPDGTPDPAWGNHSCPGGPRLDQLPAIIAAARPAPPPAPTPLDPELEIIMSLATSNIDALNFVIRDKWATYRTDTLSIPALEYLQAVYNQKGLDATLACIIDTASQQGKLRPQFAGAA